jgi:hypothetical protein
VLPSAEDAIDAHDDSDGALTFVQVLPESAEVYIGPFADATTSLIPSAEEATDLQFPLAGKPFVAWFHELPELVEK